VVIPDVQTSTPAEPRPNVLLVVLDSVRARDLGLYGYERDTSQFMERFAKTATVYDQAKSPGIHSIASHASIWTGTEVEQHGLTRHEDTLASGTTVWETLNEAGYETGLFTTNAVVAHASNLAEPFETVVTDEFVDTGEKVFPGVFGPTDVRNHEGIRGNVSRVLGASSTPKAFVNSAYHAVRRFGSDGGSSMDTSDLLVRFDAWRADRSAPWAACLNLMDAHYPYEPGPEHDRWGDDRLGAMQDSHERPPSYEYTHGRPWWELEVARHLYDGAVRQADRAVKRVVTALADADVLDETLVVVTSDHGEGFGECSRLEPSVRLVDHSWGIHEVLTHVPLVVSFPGRSEGDRVSRPVSLSAVPDVVDDALDGTADPASFVREDPVVASTYRLLESDLDLFTDSDVDGSAHLGPWRAVYEQSDGSVVKHAQHGETAKSFVVRDAQHSYPVSGSPADRVEAVFDRLEDAGVKAGSETVDDAVEDRLDDLGYVR
jgi:arylsulfatase A-like enzyme